jgi:hypothetical protein
MPYKVDQPVIIEHVSTQDRPDPRGELHCLWCPNKTWTLLLGTSSILTIVKNRLKMRKLHPPKVTRSRTPKKNKPPNTTKVDPWTPKKFLICCFVAIRSLRWCSYSILNSFKWIKNKKVMKFESRRGPKRKKKQKKKHFVSWKAYFSSCHFFINLFHLHFKDDF